MRVSPNAAAAEPDDNEHSCSPDAKRKFQMWRANTTGLLIDAEKSDRDEDHGAHRNINENKVKDLVQILRRVSKSSERDLDDQVSNIVSEALVIDKMISRQVAEVTWLFDSDRTSTLDSGEKRGSHNVCLVVAPGMIKRGKSTGAEFDIGNLLLETELWSEPRTTDGVGEHHRDTTGSFVHKAKGFLNSIK